MIITLKNQKVTVAANDYEIIGATGRIFYTNIRQTMRGTDSAATASALATHDGKLDTVDTNVDAILVDTGTTIPAQISGLNDVSSSDVQTACDAAITANSDINTIDTNVDAILVDTGTTLPAQISGLNDLSAAEVNTEMVDVLTVDTYSQVGQETPAGRLGPKTLDPVNGGLCSGGHSPPRVADGCSLRTPRSPGSMGMGNGGVRPTGNGASPIG